MTPAFAQYAAIAKLIFDRLDVRSQRLVRNAVKRLITNPAAGFWLGESSGFVVRMLPVDGWRIYYTLWENEITITEILPASQAPNFPT